MNLYETSPVAYAKKYFYGEEFTNAAMRFGSEVASALEEDESDDQAIEHVRLIMPRYDKKEHEMLATFDGIPLKCRFDLFTRPPQLDFGEVKTGRVPWTQSRVDRHGQLFFYAFVIWLNHRIVVPHPKLFWLPTEIVDGRIQLTGEVHPFTANITLQQLLLFATRVSSAWQGIQTLTQQHYSQFV